MDKRLFTWLVYVVVHNPFGLYWKYGQADVDGLDKDGDPPLVFALVVGSAECVRALIMRGANVRSKLRDGFGPSVPQVWAYYGQPDCMRELLLAGADPNAVDDEGESVLHRALAKKYTNCALAILENGGCRPLHLCIATWNVAVVKRWLEIAFPEEIAERIDLPSPVGIALCMAATVKKDHKIDGRELVPILLAAGLDPTVQNSQLGRTALHTVAMANDVDLVKINS
ncbi:E3 ubiquitin-protein ligase KEG-like [Mercurialis annua]|uniref:E3 ubiquitin-protein ligase KEG-like n=1 Tax=Mercurialis annua TaxID=3986 RepID=UPI00216048D4|nr:E3 ubiquitin-protein ligase KEG-like [Mercurialis annua]